MSAERCKAIIDAETIRVVYEEARTDNKLARKLDDRPDLAERLLVLCAEVAGVAGIGSG